ncbi:MAG: UDP-N-acetylmuramoyl-tripeptide--D-alanyl-D-alanine ligase [Phycisphaera sp.]|nr:UDP-N-acetylmuramoyl-tripeptide--D-alanyl-D-alanine ligase [Phycisphaera sp.]
MIDATLERLATAVGGRISGDPATRIVGVGIDTRGDLAGRLFVAIAGERHDGHDHVAAAREAGAVAALVSRGEAPDPSFPLLSVEDTTTGLASLARHHRGNLAGPVVGVTGSAGKTTTRGLLEAVLAPLGAGTASIKSFNNHIGVPLTILDASTTDPWVVLEMGTSSRGEIAGLVEIASPTISVVTGTGRAHLAGLGDETAVAAEKATILDGADLGIVNVDRPAIGSEIEWRRRRGDRITTYGTAPHADRRLIHRRPLPGGGQSIELDDFACELALDGAHNAVNAVAAIEVARSLGVPDHAIATALASVRPPSMRFARREIDGILVYDDAYNANPESMKASLDAFREIGEATVTAGGRRIAILGAMLELGDEAVGLHREIGECATRAGLTHLIVVADRGGGPIAEGAVDTGFEGVVQVVGNATEAADELGRFVGSGDALLVKGSRGIGLEVIVEALAARQESNG